MRLLLHPRTLLLLASVLLSSAVCDHYLLVLEDYLHKQNVDGHCASNGLLSSMPRFYLLTLLNTFHNILDTKRNEARFCDFFGKLCNPTGFTKKNIAVAYERYKDTFTLDLSATITIPDEVTEAFRKELSTKVVKGKVMTLGNLIFALEQDYKHTKTKLPKHGGKRLASIPVRKALFWLVVIEPLVKRHNIAKKILNDRIQAILAKPFLTQFKLNRVILAALKDNADFKKACETDGPGIASGLTKLFEALKLSIAPVVTAEDVENMQQHSFKFRDNYLIDSASVAGLYETTSPFEPTATEPHANIVACFVEHFFRFRYRPQLVDTNDTFKNVLKWTFYYGVLRSTVDSQVNAKVPSASVDTIGQSGHLAGNTISGSPNKSSLGVTIMPSNSTRLSPHCVAIGILGLVGLVGLVAILPTMLNYFGWRTQLTTEAIEAVDNSSDQLQDSAVQSTIVVVVVVIVILVLSAATLAYFWWFRSPGVPKSKSKEAAAVAVSSLAVSTNISTPLSSRIGGKDYGASSVVNNRPGKWKVPTAVPSGVKHNTSEINSTTLSACFTKKKSKKLKKSIGLSPASVCALSTPKKPKVAASLAAKTTLKLTLRDNI